MLRHRTTLANLLALVMLTLGLGLASVHSPSAHAGQNQAGAATSVQVMNTPKFGPVLTDSNGYVLYTFALDQPGTSNCYDTMDCATRWPPVTIQGAVVAPPGLPGTLGTTIRQDGSTQLTYNGWPLYSYSPPTGPGSSTGDGSYAFSGGLWLEAATGAVTPTIQLAPQQQGQYVVTDSNGMTLYTHSNDPRDQSLCTDACATPWPPASVNGDLIVGPGLSRVLDQITRADGTVQATLNHHPLYTFARDKQPGDENGQGINAFGGQWSVATVSATPPPLPAATSTPGPTSTPAATATPTP
jgi:predicted lipoprotein with Yx(FWY)xxD motif